MTSSRKPFDPKKYESGADSVPQSGAPSAPEGRWPTRDDIQDFAKIGGDIFKRTMASGIDIVKEVKDGLPKEASQLLAKGKQEVLRGISSDVAQSLLSGTVDKLFATIRDHKLEISIRLRGDDDKNKDQTKKSPSSSAGTSAAGKGRPPVSKS